ncbi:hypothetical protein JFQ74_002323 [Vibrio parahaemolyticus]|uniref:phosphoribosyltransferase-like protein n=1 Tax=Vibrio owensii TaxID=696485 RepID=UPI002A043904|nr:hypothetical protein [Vibrio parahaemolyticus]HCG8577649.1 hypothetical protein [Vibrio parahaemolyticus]
MQKEVFNIVFSLARKQPWLNNKVDILSELLYQECSNEEERTLILDLLERFTYVSGSRFSELINELVEEIVTDPDLTEETTQVVAMTGDYNTDSAQFVTYALKMPFERQGWRNYSTVTNFQKALKQYKKSQFQQSNLVLVDEFIGSGKTVIGRVETLTKQFEREGVTDFTIKVKVLAASSVGIKNIRDAGIDLSTLLTLEQGITEYYEPALIEEKLGLMDRLESILSANYQNRALPKRGYGGTESLYTRDDGNTPNSVFPIFWWPFLTDNSNRNTLLIRAMGDA